MSCKCNYGCNESSGCYVQVASNDIVPYNEAEYLQGLSEDGCQKFVIPLDINAIIDSLTLKDCQGTNLDLSDTNWASCSDLTSAINDINFTDCAGSSKSLNSEPIASCSDLTSAINDINFTDCAGSSKSLNSEPIASCSDLTSAISALTIRDCSGTALSLDTAVMASCDDLTSAISALTIRDCSGTALSLDTAVMASCSDLTSAINDISFTDCAGSSKSLNSEPIASCSDLTSAISALTIRDCSGTALSLDTAVMASCSDLTSAINDINFTDCGGSSKSLNSEPIASCSDLTSAINDINFTDCVGSSKPLNSEPIATCDNLTSAINDISFTDCGGRHKSLNSEPIATCDNLTSAINDISFTDCGGSSKSLNSEPIASCSDLTDAVSSIVVNVTGVVTGDGNGTPLDVDFALMGADDFCDLGSVVPNGIVDSIAGLDATNCLVRGDITPSASCEVPDTIIGMNSTGGLRKYVRSELLRHSNIIISPYVSTPNIAPAVWNNGDSETTPTTQVTLNNPSPCLPMLVRYKFYLSVTVAVDTPSTVKRTGGVLANFEANFNGGGFNIFPYGSTGEPVVEAQAVAADVSSFNGNPPGNRDLQVLEFVTTIPPLGVFDIQARSTFFITDGDNFLVPNTSIGIEIEGHNFG